MSVHDALVGRAGTQQVGTLGQRRIKTVHRLCGIGELEWRMQQHPTVGRLGVLKLAYIASPVQCLGRRPLVKGAQQADQGLQVAVVDMVVVDALEQCLVQRQTAHQHQPVLGFTRGWQLGPGHQREGAIVPLERHHAKVHARRQTHVQADFFLAIKLPRFKGCEVEKRKTNRLFEFKNPRAHQEQP